MNEECYMTCAGTQYPLNSNFTGELQDGYLHFGWWARAQVLPQYR